MRWSYRSICPFCPLDTHNCKRHLLDLPHTPCPQDRGCSHTGCSKWDICHLNANTITFTQFQVNVFLRFLRCSRGVISLPSHWQVAVLRCRGVTKLRRAVLWVDMAVLSRVMTSSQKRNGQSRPAHSFCTTCTIRTPVISSITAAEEFSLRKTTWGPLKHEHPNTQYRRSMLRQVN